MADGVWRAVVQVAADAVRDGCTDELPHFDFADVFDADEYLYFYEDTLRTEDTPAQVDFHASAIGLSPGHTVVDLGCGHGRHANELARRGDRVLGVDLVPGFIERARAEAALEGLPAEYVLGDVRAVHSLEAFDHAFSLFDAFGFLDDAGNEDFLRATHAVLRTGGSLVLDVRNRDWMVRSLLPFTVLDKGDDMMVDRHQFDVATGRFIDRRTYIRAGKSAHGELLHPHLYPPRSSPRC